MARDRYTSKRIEITKKLLVKQTKVKELPVSPHPLTPLYFAERMPEYVSESLSEKIFEFAKQKGHLNLEDNSLKKDPRDEILLQQLHESDDAEINAFMKKHINHVAEEMNVLYALHEMTSEKKEVIFKLFNQYIK